MPTRLIEDQNRVRTVIDLAADFLKVRVHCLCVAPGHDNACTLTLLRADRPEYLGPKRSLIVGGRWTRSPLRPSPRHLVLLPDAGFILPPQLYFCAGSEGLADRADRFRETFLKSSTANSFWA